MMRSSSTHFGVAFLFSFLSCAVLVPLRARADEAPPVARATGKCMMWKVASKTATVYLVGSMHLSTQEMYPLPREMEAAFDKSDTLVVEVNINKVDQAKMGALIQSKGMYPGDQTLSGSIKKETWQRVQETCKELGIPADGMEKMKPWLVGTMLEILQIQKLGFDPNLGIDKHFLDLAGKKNKPIEELETADFQINLMAGFDDKLQEQSLALTLADGKDLKSDIKLMSEAWTDGDVDAIDSLLNKQSKKHPEMQSPMDKLISDRNGPMAQKIEHYLEGTKTVFVVAGCAHMIGEKGIVKILRDDQYKVAQSPATPRVETDK